MPYQYDPAAYGDDEEGYDPIKVFAFIVTLIALGVILVHVIGAFSTSEIHFRYTGKTEIGKDSAFVKGALYVPEQGGGYRNLDTTETFVMEDNWFYGGGPDVQTRLNTLRKEHMYHGICTGWDLPMLGWHRNIVDFEEVML